LPDFIVLVKLTLYIKRIRRKLWQPANKLNPHSTFYQKLNRSNDDIKDLIKLIAELETLLKTYNADEDLEIDRSIKAEIRRVKKQIDELRKNIDKLARELRDTNKKCHYLS